MSLLSPWALIWLVAAGAIVGLYLLKPRSRRFEVSSTWLWQGAIQHESARSLIQWLKRHLLLMLQLAVALAGIFALARPALTNLLTVNRTAVIALDASAAMLASDGDPAVVAAVTGGAVPPAVSRFDEARAVALHALAQLQAGDRVVILRMADRAEVVAQGVLPDDAPNRRRAIERLPVAPAPLDLQQALEVASSLTRTARIGEVLVITGGVVGANQFNRPPVNLHVHQVGRGGADNQAITQLAARHTVGGELEVFVRLTNFAEQAAEGTLRFAVDGQPFGEQAVSLAPNGTSELLLTDLPPNARVVEAVFNRRDLLALDNVATAAVTVPPVRRVLLVGGRSDQLERALRAVPGVQLEKTEPERYNPQGGFDIYVFEGWFPPAPPPGHWVLIDPPRNNAAVPVLDVLGRRVENGREVNTAQIARVVPSPLLQGVDLAGVGVVEAKRLALPPWAEEVVSARDGPLIFMGYSQPYRAVVFGFDLRASNLFGRVGFPVLIANVINWLTGDLAAGGFSSGGSGIFQPGESLLIQPLPRATRVEIETPAGRRYRFDGNQPVRFLDTERPGAYTVIQFAGRDEIARRVYVASVLPPGREAVLADLRPRESIQGIATAGGPSPAPIILGPGQERRVAEWWRFLALFGLIGLLVEWWWFHR